MTVGPRVVAIGGGHGLAATLRAARSYAGQVTAIVSVADDGGSSGRLRDALGIPAPGDLRRCLVALARDPESVWARTFEHRFEGGELDGHAAGNLIIAGLAAAAGDFTAALDQAGRLLDVQGRVLPATTSSVVLKAESASGPVQGQVRVSEVGRISAVSLVPPDAEPPPGAVAAIAEADQILLGPGSLFTSVIAAIAVPALREAVSRAAAPLVYICNLQPQDPETTGYDAAAHVEALVAHGVRPDLLLWDPASLPLGNPPVPVREAPLGDEAGGAHDPSKLAAALQKLIG